MKTVYQCISAVQKELAEKGIGKNHKNAQQGYVFRGIDDVYNALAPSLATHGLVILPEVIDRQVIERATRNGGALFYVTLSVKYHFVSSHDGSSHAVIAIGEAMDSGDKATNKAMSAAYKYACFQTFCIPTEAMDADAETHEVAPKKDNRATTAALDGVSFTSQQKQLISEYVAGIQAAVFNQDDSSLLELMEELSEDGDMKIAVWRLLDSKDRSYIKKTTKAVA